MLRNFIDFPEVFAKSVSPIVEVVGGLVTLAVAGILLSGLLAVLTVEAPSRVPSPLGR
jgi:hypothetical protein